MKFKYTGTNDCFCLELVAYKIMGKGEYLQKGMIIDVPDDNKIVINALDAMGTFHRVKENKTIKKEVKKNKEK